MDAYNDPAIKRIICMCSSQVAKTTMIENVIGYFTHHDPSPMMVVTPTLEIAESFSKDRLAPMIRDTPALRERFADEGSKSSGNTLLHKKFAGGHLTIAGANSYNSLASRPIRILLGDEAAKWKMNEQGSPFRQASARTKAFWNAKEGYYSTPTGTVGGFQDIWDQSDKRLFEVSCPGCKAMVVLAFDETPGSIPTDFQDGIIRAVLKWTEQVPLRTDDGRRVRRASDAWFECMACNRRFTEVDRAIAVKNGRWRATMPFYDTAGYWIWEAYSPFSSALKIANLWLSALGDVVQLQSVKNETLGLPWRQTGDAPSFQRLFERRELNRQVGEVPIGALFLTAAVDVQADRLEFEVKAWGRRKESWSIYYEVIQPVRKDSRGNMVACRTSDPDPWERLAELIDQDWPCDGGGFMAITCCGVDTGYNPDPVYEFCRRYPQPSHSPSGSLVRSARTVVPIKGGHNAFKLIEGVSDTDAAKKRGGLKIVTIGTPAAKQEIYDALRLDMPADGASFPPGYVDHPDYSLEYFQGLTAETRVVKESGAIEWRKDNPRNEPLDLHVYNRACAELCGIGLYQEPHWAELERRRVDASRTVELPPVAAAALQPATAPGRRVFAKFRV